MADLPVVAVIRARAGGEDVVRAALSDLVPPTRAEAGCVAYDLYESASEPGIFVTVETWKSQADLDGHMASAHIAATFATAGEQLAGAPEIHVLNRIDV